MTYDDLKRKLEEIIDPGFDKPLGEVKGIKKLVIGPTGVIELEVYLKDMKMYEREIKIKIIRLVKIDLEFPGIKVSFFESKFLKKGERAIKYLAIASGKGGVGKSTVTANLAIALVRKGKKVGIIDADVYGASIPYVLGLEIKPITATKNEKMIPLVAHNIEVISTEFFLPPEKPVMWRGPMLGKLLSHFFSGVKWQDGIDIILIDLPPGTGDVALDVKSYAPSTKVLVVTTPHVNAANVAVKAGLGAQQIGHEVIGVIENMSYYMNKCSNEKDYIFGKGGVASVSQSLGVNIYGQIPIAQPKGNGYLFNDNEEVALIYDDIAKAVIFEMEI